MADVPIDFTDVDDVTESSPPSMTITASEIDVNNGPMNQPWSVGKIVTSFLSGKDYIVKYEARFNRTLNTTDSFMGLSVRDTGGSGQNLRIAPNGTKITYCTFFDRGAIVSVFIDDGFIDGSGNFQRHSVNIIDVGSLSTDWLYYEFKKVGTAVTWDAWTDSGKGTHISGFPLAITVNPSNDVEMANLLCIANADLGLGTVVEGGHRNMVVDFGGEAPSEDDVLVGGGLGGDNVLMEDKLGGMFGGF